MNEPTPDIDPLAEDAPLIALLSLSTNPLLATATPEQLQQVVARCRTLAAQPVSLKAAVAAEGEKKVRASATAKAKQAALDLLGL